MDTIDRKTITDIKRRITRLSKNEQLPSLDLIIASQDSILLRVIPPVQWDEFLGGLLDILQNQYLAETDQAHTQNELNDAYVRYIAYSGLGLDPLEIRVHLITKTNEQGWYNQPLEFEFLPN